MRVRIGLLAAVVVIGGVSPVRAQVVEFSGQVQASNLTAIPWVTGSTMWGQIDSGNAGATSAVGFTSLSFGGFNPALFTWTIGNGGELELGLNQSPGPALIGFEVYENTAGPAVDIQFSYNGDLWASGVVDQVRSEVANVNAQVGTGTGLVTLTAAGVDDSFFNEVIALTGGSGKLNYTFTAFNPVNAQGLFNSLGSFTAVPEPTETAMVFGILGLGAVVLHRRIKAQKLRTVPIGLTK